MQSLGSRSEKSVMEFEGRSRILTELNIAPLIDVVFLLLIFFMLTSTLISQQGLEIVLPSSSESQQIEHIPVEVVVNKDGKLSLNGEELDQAKFIPALRRLLGNKNKEVIVLKADRGVRVQLLINIMDKIRAAGGISVSLATKQE